MDDSLMCMVDCWDIVCLLFTTITTTTLPDCEQLLYAYYWFVTVTYKTVASEYGHNQLLGSD